MSEKGRATSRGIMQPWTPVLPQKIPKMGRLADLQGIRDTGAQRARWRIVSIPSNGGDTNSLLCSANLEGGHPKVVSHGGNFNCRPADLTCQHG